MNQRIQFAMLIGVVLLSLPLAMLVNSTKTLDSKPQASDTTFHASFAPGPDGLSCAIDDVKHKQTLQPGEQLTLKAGISGGSGAYTIKWKAQDKDFDTSSLDAQGLGTFVDTGTPVSTINPTVWFAPSAFRGTTQIEITLFVYDQDKSASKTSCSLVYRVKNNTAE